MKELVECHSGYQYCERPIAIWWQNERLTVVQIIEEMRSPNGKNFRVNTQKGFLFDLTYEESTDQWTITPL
ncbi:MAG: hypothetical protein ACPL3P_03740 [Anaerolineales bacterium]